MVGGLKSRPPKWAGSLRGGPAPASGDSNSRMLSQQESKPERRLIAAPFRPGWRGHLSSCDCKLRCPHRSGCVQAVVPGIRGAATAGGRLERLVHHLLRRGRGLRIHRPAGVLEWLCRCDRFISHHVQSVLRWLYTVATTPLQAATAYQYRVRYIENGIPSLWSTEVEDSSSTARKGGISCRKGGISCSKAVPFFRQASRRLMPRFRPAPARPAWTARPGRRCC